MAAVANTAQIFNRVFSTLRTQLPVVQMFTVTGTSSFGVHDLAVAVSALNYYVPYFGWYAVLFLLTRHEPPAAFAQGLSSAAEVPPLVQRSSR